MGFYIPNDQTNELVYLDKGRRTPFEKIKADGIPKGHVGIAAICNGFFNAYQVLTENEIRY